MLALILCGGVVGPSWSAEPLVDVVVQGDRVNIRAKATNDCEVVTQKNFGDILQAKHFGKEWVEVVPPAEVVLYVLEDYLHESTVKASTLNVRAGPSGNYNAVGQLKRNDLVERTGENKNGWVGIKPTVAMSLFVSNEFVKFKDPPEKPVEVVQVVPAPNPAKVAAQQPAVVQPSAVPPVQPMRRVIPDRVTPVKAVGNAAIEPRTIPLPQGHELLPVQGQGQAAKRQGIIQSYFLSGGAPSKYHLVIDTGNGRQKVCYLDNGSGELKAYKGKVVMIEGWDYWVQGEKLPLMVVDQIRVIR